MSYEKGNLTYSFFILLTQLHEPPALKLTNFNAFIIPIFLLLFSKGPYLFAHIKINYETGYIRTFSEELQICIQNHCDI